MEDPEEEAKAGEAAVTVVTQARNPTMEGPDESPKMFASPLKEL